MGTWGRANFCHSKLFLDPREMLGGLAKSLPSQNLLDPHGLYGFSTPAAWMDSRPPRAGWIFDPRKKEGVG